MSPVYSPIQYYSLLKSCMIFLIVQAVVVFLFFPFIWSSGIMYRFLMLFINVAVSIVFGRRLYRQRYHLVFSYDDKGFSLKQGTKNEIRHRWSEFSSVSLARTEHGDFSIRLHNSDFFDLPVSTLKLNPFGFREEATKLVAACKKTQSS